jgi:hypothetical protein
MARNTRILLARSQACILSSPGRRWAHRRRQWGPALMGLIWAACAVSCSNSAGKMSSCRAPISGLELPAGRTPVGPSAKHVLARWHEERGNLRGGGDEGNSPMPQVRKFSDFKYLQLISCYQVLSNAGNLTFMRYVVLCMLLLNLNCMFVISLLVHKRQDALLDFAATIKTNFAPWSTTHTLGTPLS